MRIAAVYEPRLVNAHYRVLLPMAELRKRGHEVELLPQQDGEPRLALDRLAQFDVVHVHRIVVNGDPTFVQQLHDAGVAVCFDNDDDAGAVAPEMWKMLHDEIDPESVRRVVREHERSLALLPQVDVATTPSRVLAERFRAAGAHDVRVIENRLGREQRRARPVQYDGFTIGWHGGREHRWDVAALGLDEQLAALLEAHPHLHVATIGVKLDLDGNRYVHREWVELDELPNHVAGFDIGLAPLAGDAFSIGRSAVKVREYASLGVPWVASAVEPYRGLGDDEGGCLVAPDGWFEALDRLIRSPLERMRLRRRAKRWAKRELVEAAAGEWEAALADAVDRARAGARGAAAR